MSVHSDGPAGSSTPAVGSIDADVQRYSRSLVRRCILVLVATGALIVIGCTMAQGIDGLWGALVGVVMVVAFFGIDVLALRWLKYTPPVQVLAVVVMIYVFKITLLAIFLVRLRGSDLFDAASFGVAVIVLTTVALGAAVVLVARQPVTIEPAESGESVVGQGLAGEQAATDDPPADQ